jgi:serine/threonine protein kinase
MDRPDELGSMPTGDFSRLQEQAERLERSWQSQPDPAIGVDLGQFLPPASDPLRLPLLYELVKIDLSFRMERGQLLGLDYYLEKFPELGPPAKLSPHLILEEYLIRKRQGIPTRLSDYKVRYPEQFPQFEKLIPKDDKPYAAPSGGASSGGGGVPFLLGLGQGRMLLGRFQLIKRIGAGQFGEVWKALDTQGGIEKALKIILRPMDTEEAKAELQALEIIKRLNHPYLLRTESYAPEDDRLIVVMELAQGSLRDVLKKCKKDGLDGIPVPDLLRYFHNAAAALDYLHKRDIVHRDIKPDNILLVEEYAKIADLGLAKLMAHGRSMTASLAGTMAYMAPEVWRERISPQADQYSLAVSYGELRQGKTPFQGRNLADFFHAHTDNAPSLDALPEDERQVLRKALAKNPHQRFLSCVEFMRALDEAISHPIIRKDDASGRPAQPRQRAPVVEKVNVGGGTISPDTHATLAPSTLEPKLLAEEESPLTEKPHDTGSREQKLDPTWKDQQKKTAEKAADWKTGGRTAAEPITAKPKIASTMVVSAVAAPRGRWRVVATAGFVLVAGSLGLGFWSYQEKGRLEEVVHGHVAQRSFSEAFEAVDASGYLTLPFRSGLRETVRNKAIDYSVTALEEEPRSVEIACKAVWKHAPGDAQALKLWGKSLETLVLGKNGLVANQEYREAWNRVQNLPEESGEKKRLRDKTEETWTQKADKELANAQWAQALATTEDMLTCLQTHSQAEWIRDRASKALAVEARVRSREYRLAHDTIPGDLPNKGAAALKAKVLTAWRTTAVQKFEANDLPSKKEAIQHWLQMEAVYPEVKSAKEDYQGKYFQVLVAKADQEAKASRFEEGLTILAEAQSHAARPEDKVGLQQLRKQAAQGHRDQLLRQANSALDEKNVQGARVHLAKLEKHEADSDYDMPVKNLEWRTLQARTLVQGLKTAGELEKALRLFQDVNKRDNKGLAPLCQDWLDACGRDAAIKETAKTHLIQARTNLARGPVYERITALVPTFALVKSAQGFLADKNPAKALETLRGIAGEDVDADLKADYLRLYEDLGEGYATGKTGIRFERPDLALLETAKKDSAKLANIYPRAMARYIEETVPQWPKDDKEWENRFRDCRNADPANPWVQATLLEYWLHKGKVPEGTPVLDAPEVPYARYIKAQVLASNQKHADAVPLVLNLDPQEKWFIKPRQEKAASLLQDAAQNLRAPGKLFETAEAAELAFSCLETACTFSGITDKQLPEQARLDLALAALYKKKPDLQRGRTLAEEVRASSAEKDYLFLATAASFGDIRKELKSYIDSKKTSPVNLLTDKLSPVLALGESQVKEPEATAEVQKRQARWLATKAWLLRTHPKEPWEFDPKKQALSAYDAAINLDADPVDYWIDRAYVKASLAQPDWTSIHEDANQAVKLASQAARPYDLRGFVLLHQARQESDLVKRTDTLASAHADVARALKLNSEENDLPDLLYRGSVIALELGNYQMQLNDLRIRENQEWKKHLKEAANLAELVATKYPKENAELVQAALGNALEDLAWYLRENQADNYAKADTAFSEAIAISQRGDDRADPWVSRARCRYRWSQYQWETSGQAPADLVTKSLDDIDQALKRNPKPVVAAEAFYWKGKIHWTEDRKPRPGKSAWPSDAKRAHESFAAALNFADKGLESARHALDEELDLAKRLLAKDQDLAIQAAETAQTQLQSFKRLDSLQKQDLTARAALISGEAYELKKQFPKALEAYENGLPADLEAVKPSPVLVRLLIKWVRHRSLHGPKGNDVVPEGDRAVQWSDRLPKGSLNEQNARWLKTDALVIAAVARLHGTTDPTPHRRGAADKLSQAVKIGSDHPDVWSYQKGLGELLFLLMKTAATAKAQEELGQEALRALNAAAKSAPEAERPRINQTIKAIEKSASSN